MTTLREAAQQALEAWDGGDTEWFKRAYTVMEALRAALAEPVPPPEAQTEAEKMAYCAGWWDALEKARKTEPVQEPVAWMTVRLNVPIQTTARKDVANEWLKWGEVLPLYTAPPQRLPLTEEEIQAAWDSVDMRHPRGNETRIAFARAVERAHGIE